MPDQITFKIQFTRTIYESVRIICRFKKYR